VTNLEKGGLPNFEPTVSLVHGFEDTDRGRFRCFLAHLVQQMGLVFLELDNKLAPRLIDLPGR
jgi:hypothetical protein